MIPFLYGLSRNVDLKVRMHCSSDFKGKEEMENAQCYKTFSRGSSENLYLPLSLKILLSLSFKNFNIVNSNF